jgi:hypothetical protein
MKAGELPRDFGGVNVWQCGGPDDCRTRSHIKVCSVSDRSRVQNGVDHSPENFESHAPGSDSMLRMLSAPDLKIVCPKF